MVCALANLTVRAREKCRGVDGCRIREVCLQSKYSLVPEVHSERTADFLVRLLDGSDWKILVQALYLDPSSPSSLTFLPPFTRWRPGSPEIRDDVSTQMEGRKSVNTANYWQIRGCGQW
jgi:hypothetical protein